MNEMVNRLVLKRVIIRRFINDSDDEEVDGRRSRDSDIEIIGDNDSKKSENSFNEFNSSPPEVSNNDKYTNYKIIVRSCGQIVERYVDLNGNNPFAVNDTLDQVMACHDLRQIETILRKSPSNSQTNLSVAEEREEELNSNVIPNRDKYEKPNDCNEFETKAKELELEGIRHLKKKKKTLTFKCHVCDIKVIGLQLASDHSKSDFHLKKIFGDDLKGMDALFTIDSEAIGDVQMAIARKRELKKISSIDKQRFLNHGIRLKDGFGSNAYICSKCNLSFRSLKEVDKHSKSFDTIVSEPNICKTNELSDNKPKTTSISNVDQKLHSEGIKATESTDGSKFYCIFCNIYFEYKRIAVSHICDTRHKKQKRSENLNEIDSHFTVESNRIDELEVAFARKTVLKTIDPKIKIEFTKQSVRLQDGIGSNAFICLRCELPIESIQQIEEHIKSLTHTM